jgi:hypothetical protein
VAACIAFKIFARLGVNRYLDVLALVANQCRYLPHIVLVLTGVECATGGFWLGIEFTNRAPGYNFSGECRSISVFDFILNMPDVNAITADFQNRLPDPALGFPGFGYGAHRL